MEPGTVATRRGGEGREISIICGQLRFFVVMLASVELFSNPPHGSEVVLSEHVALLAGPGTVLFRAVVPGF
jgi:hypothetical protein